MRADFPPRWVMVSWIVLMGALFALLLFAGSYGRRKQEAELRHLLFADTGLPAADLRDCLAGELPLTGRWETVGPARDQAWNEARHLRVELIDEGEHRRLEVSTPRGRPLRDQESAALHHCLSPG
jgi:hypothetical protein